MKATIILPPSFQLLVAQLAHGFSTLSILKSHRPHRYRHNNEGSVKIASVISRPKDSDTIGSVGDENRRTTVASSSSHRYASRLFSHDEDIDIEPYVGPIGSVADMEGGIAISELALNVLAGPSLVSEGRGLFLCMYDDSDDSDSDVLGVSNNDTGAVEEIIIPRGTPLCGYARGYFASEGNGDKSVGFLFAGDGADQTAVFYNKELVTLGDALWSVHEQRCSEGGGGTSENKNENGNDLLFGHIVDLDKDTGRAIVKQDDDFTSRIFVPEVDVENQFSATSLGIYANDLAYDPGSNELEYFEASENNNVLQLVWRLAREEKYGNLVPTWPVVIAKKDLRLLNSVPMEVGLQYGYNYWDAVTKEGVSKYMSDRA